MKKNILITLVSTFSLLSFLHAENLYVLAYNTAPELQLPPRGGTVGVYDSTTGAAINESLITFTSNYPSGIAVTGSNLYISTYVGGSSSAGDISKYNATNGALIWKTSLASSSGANGIAATSDTIYVVDARNEVILTYNATNGVLKNASFISGVRGAIAVFGNNLYVATGNSTIGKYNATTGAGISSFISGLTGVQGLFVKNNILYVINGGGSRNGIVGIYNAETGSSINNSFIAGYRGSLGVAVVGNTLYLTAGESRNNYISRYILPSGWPVNSRFIGVLGGQAYLTTDASTSSDSSDATIVQFTNSFSFSAIARLQNNQLPAARGIATTPSPQQWTLNTANLLQFLALDKYALGQYPATSFPVGSKIVCITTYYPTQTNANNIDYSYKVMSRSNTLIADVSDIISFSIDGRYRTFIDSGRVSAGTLLYAPAGTNDFISTITFDDTWISGGANIKCYLSGVTKNIIINTAPINRDYKETQITTQAGAFGEGYYRGTEMIITGGFTQSSTNTLKLP
jgi:outer membrane protein assembly factor BamB